jgi:hypothetical protein
MITLVSPGYETPASLRPPLDRPATPILMLERFQERFNRRLPQRTPVGSPEQPMPVAAEGGQCNVFRPTTRANESTGHLARQIRREK